jgi:hypothetical protein
MSGPAATQLDSVDRDMAERVIADYHGVDPEPPNSKSYDVVAQDGATIQVKALRHTKSSKTFRPVGSFIGLNPAELGCLARSSFVSDRTLKRLRLL